MFKTRKFARPGKRIGGLIAAGTVVDGNVLFAGGLRIDGTVRGNVASAKGQSGTLVVSEQTRVDGEVRVSHVVVNGAVRGPIFADGYLELGSKARIVGDVTYKRLEMHQGAVVQGKLSHAEPETASVVELKRAASD